MYDLKGFRQAFGLTQKNIADIFNCGQANVSSMEKSMRDLEPEQYKKLCERFDVASVDKFKVTDFIYDSKKKNVHQIIMAILLICSQCRQWEVR